MVFMRNDSKLDFCQLTANGVSYARKNYPTSIQVVSFLYLYTNKNKSWELHFNLYLLTYSFVMKSLILTKSNGINFALFCY